MRTGEVDHSRFFEGFESAGDPLDGLHLSPPERLLVSLAASLVHVRRETVGRAESALGIDPIARYLGGRATHEIVAQGCARRERDGGHYLAEDQVCTFERDGVVGPFPILPRDEALALGRWVRELHEREWDGNCAYGARIHRAFKASGMMRDINHSGQYQALFQPKLWQVLRRPEVTQPFVSLLGPDVICWRQQFFDKPSGAQGTFWHQASRFRVISKKDRIRPGGSTAIDPAMLQYTLWLALEDVSDDNGSLRIAPGSYRDDRLERLAELIVAEPIKAMSTLPSEVVADTVKLLRYGPNEFDKVRALFQWVLSRCGDLFADSELRSYPMKAGEGIIFTSLNVHGSYANTTPRGRLAFAARVTGPHTAVYEGWTKDTYILPTGNVDHSVAGLKCIQMAGERHYGGNRMARAPE